MSRFQRDKPKKTLFQKTLTNPNILPTMILQSTMTMTTTLLKTMKTCIPTDTHPVLERKERLVLIPMKNGASIQKAMCSIPSCPNCRPKWISMFQTLDRLWATKSLIIWIVMLLRFRTPKLRKPLVNLSFQASQNRVSSLSAIENILRIFLLWRKCAIHIRPANMLLLLLRLLLLLLRLDPLMADKI